MISRTGRDIQGASGSSVEHTSDSLETAASQVQRGNAPEERKRNASSVVPVNAINLRNVMTLAQVGSVWPLVNWPKALKFI